MNLREITNENYHLYADVANELVKSEHYDEAEKLLLQIIEIMEKVALETGEGVAPAYYEKLSLLYKKKKVKESENDILARFLRQPKARGSRPRKIYEKYLKLNKGTSEEELRNTIYSEYEKNINRSKRSKTEAVCSTCGNSGLYLIPIDNNGRSISVFGTCCPFCCVSDIVEA